MTTIEATATNPPSSSAEPEQVIRESAQRVVSLMNSLEDKFNDGQFPDEIKTEISQCLLTVASVPEHAIVISVRVVYESVARFSVFHADFVSADGDPQKTSRTGWPLQRWVMAIDEIRHCLKLKPKVRVPLRPVAELLAEHGDDARRHIYVAKEYSRFDSALGESVGPFFVNGEVQVHLVEKEARNPGSVIPAGWHPEDGRIEDLPDLFEFPMQALTKLRKSIKASAPRLAAVTEDPASVEDLLRMGQFIPVIARIKNVTEAEVLRVAASIGVRPSYASDLFEAADLHSPEDKLFRDSMLGAESTKKPVPSPSPAEEKANPVPVPESSEPAAASDDGNAIDDALRQMFEDDPDTDTPKAMQKLKSLGISAKGTVVGRALAQLKRQALSSH